MYYLVQIIDSCSLHVSASFYSIYVVAVFNALNYSFISVFIRSFCHILIWMRQAVIIQRYVHVHTYAFYM